jgi:hypothetical protein
MMTGIKLYLPEEFPLAELAEFAALHGMKMQATESEDETTLVYIMQPYKPQNQPELF